jgi:hypothetical protein
MGAAISRFAEKGEAAAGLMPAVEILFTAFLMMYTLAGGENYCGHRDISSH